MLMKSSRKKKHDSRGLCMTNVAVVGTGYVGTVTAVCLAHLGHRVVGLDADRTRAAELAAGQLPFVEPGLAELLRVVVDDGSFDVTSDPRAVRDADVVFLCVGTPTAPDGLPDMSQVQRAACAIAPHLPNGVVLVNKSTVPVGSGNWVHTLVEECTPGRAWTFSVVSNPEFLREGAAVEDFLHPDRIVLGGEDAACARVAELYDRVLRQDFPGGRPQRRPQLIRTTLPSAEMVKYAANAFLATKISFANEVAGMCELVGADARQVLPAIGADSRIGPKFLHPGIGWGGSCFGKDVAAMIATGAEYGHDPVLLRATVTVNQSCRAAVLHKLHVHLKTLKGRRIAVLGLAFKPGTDDLRDSPGLDVLERLHAAGAVVSAYDPVVKQVPPPLSDVLRVAVDAYDAADRADAVVVATEWPDFAVLDLPRLARAMHGALVVDGRGILDQDAAVAAGLTLCGFGW
jgi:nucleotide sugar dehydrogenase